MSRPRRSSEGKGAKCPGEVIVSRYILFISKKQPVLCKFGIFPAEPLLLQTLASRAYGRARKRRTREMKHSPKNSKIF
jgi:hypothetical protein